MADYDNTNRGALFINDRKSTEKHPDRTGTINVEGTEYWLSGWIKKKNGDGAPYLSLSVQKKEQQQKAERPKSTFDEDSDIPF